MIFGIKEKSQMLTNIPVLHKTHGFVLQARVTFSLLCVWHYSHNVGENDLSQEHKILTEQDLISRQKEGNSETVKRCGAKYETLKLILHRILPRSTMFLI